MVSRVTVAGGGIAGMVAAIALRRSGLAVSVYEAYADPAGSVGSFLSLTANGLRALRALDCLDTVVERGLTVTRLCLWNAAGRSLGTVARGGRSPDHLSSLTIMRGDLVSALRAEAVRAGARIHTGKWLADAVPVAGGIAARFTDGTSAEGDLLVGADGVHSRARRIIDPGACGPEYAGVCAIDGVVDAVGIPPGDFHLLLGRRATFLYTATPAGSVWWSALVPVGGHVAELDRLSDREWRTRLTELFADDDTPAAGLVRATTTLNRPVPTYLLHQVDRWRRGRMVVIGDAAHPIGHGVGASLAVEDAVVLARCARDIDEVPAALAAYEALRRPRTDQAVHSRTFRTCLRTAPVTRWLDAVLLPIFLRYLWTRASSWLLSYDVEWPRQVRV